MKVIQIVAPFAVLSTLHGCSLSDEPKEVAPQDEKNASLRSTSHKHSHSHDPKRTLSAVENTVVNEIKSLAATSIQQGAEEVAHQLDSQVANEDDIKEKIQEVKNDVEETISKVQDELMSNETGAEKATGVWNKISALFSNAKFQSAVGAVFVGVAAFATRKHLVAFVKNMTGQKDDVPVPTVEETVEQVEELVHDALDKSDKKEKKAKKQKKEKKDK
jgi:uncharacterized membrane protein YdfJ with MMPL/SSD domain